MPPYLTGRRGRGLGLADPDVRTLPDQRMPRATGAAQPYKPNPMQSGTMPMGAYEDAKGDYDKRKDQRRAEGKTTPMEEGEQFGDYDDSDRDAGPEQDESWEDANREVLDAIDADIHGLPEPEGPDDEEDYWDKSKRATDELFERWREKLRKQGYSEQEIDAIIKRAVSLHD